MAAELRLAKSAGFCFGVRRSAGMAEELLSEGPCYALGELIHNEDMMRRLTEKGLRVIASPEELPAGERVLIRAHGASRAEYQALAAGNARICDAYANHKTARELAAEHRLNERQIERIVAAAGVVAPVDRRQATLF